jgi:hypothetical protein
MKQKLITSLVAASVLFGASQSRAVVIDFVGGTAFFTGGGSDVISLGELYIDAVDYYIEDGIKIDFIGGSGTIGNYYDIGPEVVLDNVIHAHWAAGGIGTITSIVFSKVDGSTLDLNYMDLTSNTTTGGGQASGTELSHVTSSLGTMLLPSSDWGYALDFFGGTGDGVERLFLNSDFDGILSFTVTSANADCFGLDNFFIDEPAPPAGVPDAGSTLALLGVAAAGLVGLRRKIKA